MSTEDAVDTKRNRSPNFPGIALEQAVSKAKLIWEKNGRHAVPLPGIAAAWSTSPKGSGTLIAIGALKRFGLLDELDSPAGRTFKVSTLGQKIVIGTADRADALKEAALKPEIHSTLWDLWQPVLPSDETMRSHLVFSLRFTEGGAADFIKQFRATISYAGLGGDSKIDSPPLPGEVKGDTPTPPPAAAKAEQPMQPPPAELSGAAVQIVVPLIGAGSAVLRLPRRLTPAEFVMFQELFKTLQPGIVDSQA